MIGRAIDFMKRPELRYDPVNTLARRSYYETVRRIAPARLSRLHRSSLRFTDYQIDAPLTEAVGRSLFLYGVYEPLATAVFGSLLAPGECAIDVGAHYGDFSLVAASKVGPSGTVLAFEPQDDVRAVLESNLEINSIRHVVVYSEALGRHSGEGRLYSAADARHTGGFSLLHTQVGQRDRYTTVPVRRLDDVIAAAAVSNVQAVKIDVEGAEAAVLQGAAKLLNRDKPGILFEANDLSDSGGGFGCDAFSVLDEYGYVLYGMVPSVASVFYCERIRKGQDPSEFCEPWLALNLLAVAPDSECERRLRASGRLH